MPNEGASRPAGPAGAGASRRSCGERALHALARAGDRDGIQGQAAAARHHEAVVGGRIPRQHLFGHGLLVERLDVGEGVQRRLRLQAPDCRRRPAPRSRSEYMIARMAWLLLCSGARLMPTGLSCSSLICRPPRRTSSQLSGVGADHVPQILAIGHQRRQEGVAEAEILAGLGVVRALDREVGCLAVAPLALLVDLAMVDDLILVERGRRQQHEQVVALARLGLGGRAGRDVAEPDVVDDDLGVVLLAPGLDEALVEPGRRSPARNAATAGCAASCAARAPGSERWRVPPRPAAQRNCRPAAAAGATLRFLRCYIAKFVNCDKGAPLLLLQRLKSQPLLDLSPGGHHLSGGRFYVSPHHPDTTATFRGGTKAFSRQA